MIVTIQVYFWNINSNKLCCGLQGVLVPLRGIVKGGGHASQNPHWPKIFGNFYQNCNWMTVGRVSAMLLRPQNALLRPFLATLLVPLVFNVSILSTYQCVWPCQQSSEWMEVSHSELDETISISKILSPSRRAWRATTSCSEQSDSQSDTKRGVTLVA